LVARREAVVEAGLLSEDFFMYGEDLEWCLRIRRKGWQIWYCPDAEVVHLGGQSSAVRWTEYDHMRVKLDATYRAVEIHKGRSYTRMLQASSFLALVVEWVMARITGRPTLASAFLLDYYRNALKLTAAE
jgi:GT2 family glycosyltransferase